MADDGWGRVDDDRGIRNKLHDGVVTYALKRGGREYVRLGER